MHLRLQVYIQIIIVIVICTDMQFRKTSVADPGGPQGAMAPPNDEQNFFHT